MTLFSRRFADGLSGFGGEPASRYGRTLLNVPCKNKVGISSVIDQLIDSDKSVFFIESEHVRRNAHP